MDSDLKDPSITKNRRKFTVALAGNANVGKSVIFNNLTGLHQHVGNWPGKTVKKAEGTFVHGGYTIDVIDLPGIYSLSTFSLEEIVSREYISDDHPDILINILDATALERNLFFTIQLFEMEPRIIIALNQIDIAEKRGIIIDSNKLSSLLGTPVIPTAAVLNKGVHELIDKCIELVENQTPPPNPLEYGAEIEQRIRELAEQIGSSSNPYLARFAAIKLLEGDSIIEGKIYEHNPSLKEKVEKSKTEIEEIHGHNAASVIASERYAKAAQIATEVTKHYEPNKNYWKRIEEATSHPILGYVLMLTVILSTFYGVFSFGDAASKALSEFFEGVRTIYYNLFGDSQIFISLWVGLAEGFIAGVTIAIPYIAPFFLVLSILEDSGYLARIAFLMDSAMHRIGLHGKGFIPLMLGFGCNVPACLGCSIMETERERLICAFVASLIPCAARSVVIFGLVATYMGFQWAIALYFLDFLLIFILGRFAFKAAPGEPVGLIMEMPSYKLPSWKVTYQRTWVRLREFLVEALPVMVIGNLVIFFASTIGLLSSVQNILIPITVGWLGLPSVAGVVLIFGILRKELTLTLLATLMGSSNFASFLTPAQMFTFAFVVMLYVPCIATIAVLRSEFGLKAAAIISLVEVGVAVLLGGIIFRVLALVGIG